MQVKLYELREKNPKPKTESKIVEKIKEEKKQPSLLCLKVDADQVRHSHILSMKELFRSSSGSSPVRIEFLSEGKSIGNIRIEENWGVSLTPQLEEKLKQIISVKSVQIDFK